MAIDTQRFCRPAAVFNAAPDRPPVTGYNYQSIMLAEAAGNPAVAFPVGIVPAAGRYTFNTPVTIAALWLATTIVNPAGVLAAVAVGKNNNDRLELNLASQLFFQHVSASSNTISRTGGFAFGENNGLLMNAGDAFGVYVSGSDAGLAITYMLNIVYIPRTL
jgi:hypothetical protein